MGRCTRSEGVHCLQIGCSAPNHKNKRGICETTADTQKVGERTKRVGFVATFRRVGAGKATLKVVVSSWGYEYPKCPACRRTIGRVRTLGVMWTACQRRRCSSCEASDTPPAAPPTPPAAAHDSDRAGCPRISHAIPPPPCRVIHSHRWNRNVCRCC